MIDLESKLPLYFQLKESIKKMILTSEFKEGDLVLNGYIDLTDEFKPRVNEITEIKSSSRRQNLTMYSPQVILYQTVKKIKHGRIEYILKKKDPELQVLEFDSTQIDYDNMLANVRTVAETISGLMDKNKMFWWQNIGWTCSMCWFRNLCFKTIEKKEGGD